MSQDPYAPNSEFGSVPPSLGGTPPPDYGGADPQAPNPFGAAGVSASGRPTSYEAAPQAGGLPPQVPRGSGLSMASMLKAAAAVGFIAVVGFGVYTARNEVSIDKIEVGQCLVDPGEGLLTSVTKIDCNEPHDLEVYALVDLEQSPDEAWPGTTEVESRAVDECLTRVEGFIGQDFMESAYDVTFITPVQEGWVDGDHEGVCAVINFDGSPMVGPVNP